MPELPTAPLPRVAPNLGPSSLLLRGVSPPRLFTPRKRNRAPHALRRNSFCLVFSTSLQSLFNVFPRDEAGGSVFNVSWVSVMVCGPIEAKDRPSGGGFPNGHWVVEWHWLSTKALILCEQCCGWVIPPTCTSGALIYNPTPTPHLSGSLLGNWPGDGLGVLLEPLIGCLVLSRCNLNVVGFPCSLLADLVGRASISIRVIGYQHAAQRRRSGAAPARIGFEEEVDWSGLQAGHWLVRAGWGGGEVAAEARLAGHGVVLLLRGGHGPRGEVRGEARDGGLQER